MTKYTVEVAISYKKELTIFARDEDEAEEKACNLVQGWDKVHDVEVLSVEEN